jgi:hypothetical protein
MAPSAKFKYARGVLTLDKKKKENPYAPAGKVSNKRLLKMLPRMTRRLTRAYITGCEYL